MFAQLVSQSGLELQDLCRDLVIDRSTLDLWLSGSTLAPRHVIRSLETIVSLSPNGARGLPDSSTGSRPEFVGTWNERQTSGRRLPSRNLWIYRESTGVKEYSITTTAGAKVQPYFTVPPPNDPNLHHLHIQGETADSGLIRVWLTFETAQGLKSLLGDLSPVKVGKFVRDRSMDTGGETRPARVAFEPLAVEIFMPADCYQLLRSDEHGVSDEHAFRLLLGKAS